MYKEFEYVEGDKNGVRIIVKGFQEPKEVPSDSPTFDEGVLLIATRNCWSLKLCDFQMQFMKIILLNGKEAHFFFAWLPCKASRR